MATDVDNRRRPTTPSAMRLVVGIFMILFYVGIGTLILCGVLDFYGDWEWLRWTAGIILIVYGIWRAYRQFKGSDEQD